MLFDHRSRRGVLWPGNANQTIKGQEFDSTVRWVRYSNGQTQAYWWEFPLVSIGDNGVQIVSRAPRRASRCRERRALSVKGLALVNGSGVTGCAPSKGEGKA